jgi:hypothetical protein
MYPCPFEILAEALSMQVSEREGWQFKSDTDPGAFPLT